MSIRIISGVSFHELEVTPDKSLAAEGKKPSLDDKPLIYGDNLEALKAFLTCCRAKGAPTSPLPDFHIDAHFAIEDMALLMKGQVLPHLLPEAGTDIPVKTSAYLVSPITWVDLPRGVHGLQQMKAFTFYLPLGNSSNR